MKTYGSITGTANKIKNFYGAVGHKAMLARKVYAPVPEIDAFTNVTIRSGGTGNITAVSSSATFTSAFKARVGSQWSRIVNGEIVPDYFTVERSGSTLSRKVYFYMYYHYAGSSAVNQYTIVSYSGSWADSDMRSYLNSYGITYKSSSLSNGTDYIDADLAEATKAHLIHRGFTKPYWGKVTYYSGYNVMKSIHRISGSSDVTIDDIDFDALASFISSESIDTTTNPTYYGSGSTRKWTFYKTGGVALEINHSSLEQTTGITASVPLSIFGSADATLQFFNRLVVDTTSPVVTKYLRSAAELNSLCVDGSVSNNGYYTIDGRTVATDSVISITVGCTASSIGDYFLSFSSNLTNVNLSASSIGGIGDYFLYKCSSFNSSITLPRHVVSIGKYFLAYCDAFNSNLNIQGSKLKSIGICFMRDDKAFNKYLSLPSSTATIGNYFMYNCYSFNQSFYIPSGATSIGTYFMSYMRDMVSTVYCQVPATVASSHIYTFCAESSSAASYTTGIKLGGTYGSDWQARFPDRSSSPYRNTDAV